ncbi:hypothetical protein GIX45_09800 [Erwinia sp. CPCC 100877]|nr:hypothetical protein [Erwinia sp. CPCC 100877]
MTIDFFTLLFLLFVILLYVYLWLVRKSIVIKSKRKTVKHVAIFVYSLFLVFLMVISVQDMTQRIRSLLALLVLLSFLMDTRGFSEDRLILGPFDNKGILYKDIDKIAVLLKKDELRLNYFKNDRRGTLLTFSVPLEELLAFLAPRLNEEAKIEILVDEE